MTNETFEAARAERRLARSPKSTPSRIPNQSGRLLNSGRSLNGAHRRGLSPRHRATFASS